jgi:RNA polymerase sigma-70 factor, ECF subfamily
MAPPDVHGEIVALLPRLRRFALMLTRSDDLANDLVQAAILRALDRLDQYQAGSHLDRWLFRIIRTVWLNTQRSSTLRRSEPLDHHQVGLAIDGVREAEMKIELSEVLRASLRLTSEQREAIYLVCVEGFSYAEAADFMGVPVGTLMSRLSRARAALMAMVTGADEGKVKPFPSRSVPDARAGRR